MLEIGPHEEEVRQGILEAKVRAAQAKHPRFEIPDNALEYLAHGCVRGGRALEGIVHTLVTEGLVVLDDCQVIRYAGREAEPGAGGATAGDGRPW